MKITFSILTALSFLLLPSFKVIAQNAAPGISKIRTVFKPASKSLAVYYDLLDLENDSVSIEVFIKQKNGAEFKVALQNAGGDIGFPVFSGHSKHIDLLMNDSMQPASWSSIRIVATDKFPIQMPGLLDLVDVDNLRKDIAFIGQERNVYSDKSMQQLSKVKDKIRKEFVKYASAASDQFFAVDDKLKGNNIKTKLNGISISKKLYVIGAHFDTVKDSPGNDDNASGVAVLLEVLRILSKFSFNNAVEFVGFDMEESQDDVNGSPAYSGSRSYVANMGQHDSAELAGFINLDMVGYFSNLPGSQVLPDEFKGIFPNVYDSVKADEQRGNFLLIISNDRSVGLSDRVSHLNSRYLPSFKSYVAKVAANGEDFPDFRRADHASFWDRNFTAISLGDGAYSRNFHYHTKDDLAGDINFEQLTNVVKLVLLTMADLLELKHSSSLTAPVSVH